MEELDQGAAAIVEEGIRTQGSNLSGVTAACTWTALGNCIYLSPIFKITRKNTSFFLVSSNINWTMAKNFDGINFLTFH